MCTSHWVGLFFSVLATVLTQINTDALTVLGFYESFVQLDVQWPQRFSCHSGPERHLIPRHERIRSRSVSKVLLYPSTFCCANMSFGPPEVGKYSSRVAAVSAGALCDGIDM